MRVLIISTPFIRVPPSSYGGLESVVHALALELDRLGHQVAVAAPDESRLPGGVEHIKIGPEVRVVEQDWFAAEAAAYDAYKKHLKDFEIIHEHNWMGHCYLAKRDDPSLKLIHTHHGHMTWLSPPPVQYPCLCAISNFMSREYSRRLGLNVRFVYNGIILDNYPLKTEKQKSLLYLGRITKIKQPHVAIDVARRARMAIDIVGGDRFVDDSLYVEHIKNMCDGETARYIGEVSHATKLKYLQNSRALIFPSSFSEPFGLVAVEAMACGTPVIALRDGAIPEVVEDGVTGFICETVDEMVDAVKKVDQIKPEACRARVEKLFASRVMAENYLRLFKEVLNGEEW